ncbi:hypothetical protein L208DRAFT_1409735, partial [Tricholoma matsutake]
MCARFFPLDCHQLPRPCGKLDLTILSHIQLRKRLDLAMKKVKKEQLKQFNTCKVLFRLHTHKKTWHTLLDLISTENIPGLPWILKNSNLRNWSVEKLLEMVQMALEGKYHPWNYSELELDLAIAIYELGGGAALHALLDHHQDFRLQISVGSIKMVNLLANIKT